jgi:SAM-dependent methyltransferase
VALVTRKDQCRWDARYTSQAPPPGDAVEPPGVFAAYANEFPTSGRALDLACGRGLGTIWLARRGLDVWGLDISSVAIGQARHAARRAGVDHRCRFDVTDLDDGLPAGPPVDVILCHKFRDRRLDQPIIGRLAPGGLLAIAVLSEVGAAPGPFRAAPGELSAAFADLDEIVAGEGEGCAWLLARARGSGFQAGADSR